MRTLLLYVGFVLVPLGGLLGVLHVGGQLTAPARIGGMWSIQTDTAPTCPRLAAALEPGTLTIDQSGIYLDVHVGSEALGRVLFQGDSLHTPTPETVGCDAGGLVVRGRRLSDGTLTGTLTVAACATCPPVAFHATLQPQAPTTDPSGGGH